MLLITYESLLMILTENRLKLNIRSDLLLTRVCNIVRPQVNIHASLSCFLVNSVIL